MSTAAIDSNVTGAIVARLERIPFSRWHIKARLIIGSATFFDGLDVLAIAYILPVIAPAWHLTPPMIGLLIAAGFLGQLFGAMFFGWIGERHGRIPAMVWSIATYSLFSFICALSWNFTAFFIFRTVQGFGLGGELPVASTYIGEISKAQGRGRSILFYQLAFPFGLFACALVAVWIVPHAGWRYLFVIGGLPAILTIFLRRLLPESPRWLAAHGRMAEAEAALTEIERGAEAALGRPLPPPQASVPVAARRASLSDLFGPRYRGRTLSVWVIWFATSLVNYGIAAWLPSVYRGVFHLGIAESLRYNLITTLAGLAGTVVCAFIIDSVSRRALFATVFAANGLCMLWLWLHGPDTALFVMAVVSTSYFFISFTSLGAYVYTPEIYPTRVRAIGAAAASSWARIASIAGPIGVGFMLTGSGLGSVFLMFGIVALLAAVTVVLAVVDTKNRVLEEVSP